MCVKNCRRLTIGILVSMLCLLIFQSQPVLAQDNDDTSLTLAFQSGYSFKYSVSWNPYLNLDQEGAAIFWVPMGGTHLYLIVFDPLTIKSMVNATNLDEMVNAITDGRVFSESFEGVETDSISPLNIDGITGTEIAAGISSIFVVQLHDGNFGVIAASLADENSSGIPPSDERRQQVLEIVKSLSPVDVLCSVRANSAINRRGGPGTNFDRVGQLQANLPQIVIGYENGDDGFTWYQLADETWVREDVIAPDRDCAAAFSRSQPLASSGPMAETYTSESGIVIPYPAGWTVYEADGLVLVSNTASVDAFGACPGEYMFIISSREAMNYFETVRLLNELAPASKPTFDPNYFRIDGLDTFDDFSLNIGTAGADFNSAGLVNNVAARRAILIYIIMDQSDYVRGSFMPLLTEMEKAISLSD